LFHLFGGYGLAICRLWGCFLAEPSLFSETAHAMKHGQLRFTDADNRMIFSSAPITCFENYLRVLFFLGFMELLFCPMAVGQSKVPAQRTYGVTEGAADGSSPDSSGSPQRGDAVAAS
jgi:hypothetical protein